MIRFLLCLPIMLFLIRFHYNAYALTRNPIVCFLEKFFQPLFAYFPIQRTHRFDLPSLVMALLIALLMAGIWFAGRAPFAIWVMTALYLLLSAWCSLFTYTLVLIAISSWLNPNPQQPILQIAFACTEWAMHYLRKFVPNVGMLDFSPMIALLLVYVVQEGLGRGFLHVLIVLSA